VGDAAVEAARVAAAAASGIEVGDAADAKHAAVRQPRNTHRRGGHSDATEQSKRWRGGRGEGFPAVALPVPSPALPNKRRPSQAPGRPPDTYNRCKFSGGHRDNGEFNLLVI
jgi:hypothetical protein